MKILDWVVVGWFHAIAANNIFKDYKVSKPIKVIPNATV